MSNQKRNLKMILTILLIVCLVLPGIPRAANAGQNPSLEEIAKIFDKVAQEKQVPAEILKAIAYVESGWRQWDSNGNVVANYASRTPYLGIMQVGTYNPADTAFVSKLKNDIEFNIAYGADVLISKWNMTPQIGDGDKAKLENWYFAIWAYNTWSTRNNPNNAAAAGRIAYQDKILDLIAKEFHKGVVTPVRITPVPKSSLPAGTVPSKGVTWNTPQPIHYAAYKMAAPVFSSAELALLQTVPRISGTDRIDTTVKIAEQGWPYGTETVVIAKSEDFPDALAGASLAKKYNAPILITPSNSLDPRVQEALLRLKPLKIIILGGKSAISDHVENQLKELLYWTDDFQRIAGKDRFETAALIAAQFPQASGVAIATGCNFPDALSLASAAAAESYPLLLVDKDKLPESTEGVLRNLSPSFVYVAGGEQVVSSELVQKVQEVTGLTQENITRFSGKDRYETSTQILQGLYPDIMKIFLVTGNNFPDALAGAALASKTGSPILLISPDGPGTGSTTEKYIQTLPSNVQLEAIGGPSAITDRSIIKIKTILNNQKI